MRITSRFHKPGHQLLSVANAKLTATLEYSFQIWNLVVDKSNRTVKYQEHREEQHHHLISPVYIFYIQ